jgi:ubiquinone/menaquinone biosynthesis C-methylase UbiE
MKKYLGKLFDDAYRKNKENIIDSCVPNSQAKILDLGCDNGDWTIQMAQKIGSTSMFGVEIIQDRVRQARIKGIEVTEHDLNEKLPFDNDVFDVVHANQVIEHVAFVDLFMSEIHRVLKPGGYTIISTENASSWHNIGAMILGWQMFSLTNLSTVRLGVGNPMALHRGETDHLYSWTHKTIFSYRGLKEFLQIHGFRSVNLKGAGYYPLPAWVGTWDPRHAHFITAFAVKDEKTRVVKT